MWQSNVHNKSDTRDCHTAPLRCFVLPGGGKYWSCTAYRVRAPSASVIRLLCVAVTRLDAAHSRLANASNPFWQMHALYWGMWCNWLQPVFRNCNTGHPTPLHILSPDFVLIRTESGRWIAWVWITFIMIVWTRQLILFAFRTFGFAHTTFLGTFAKLLIATISFVVSVCPHGTARLPLDGFSWNFVFENFSKTFREGPSLFKIWQE
jgi:hypothetical protein